MLQAPVSQREGAEPDAGPQAALPEPQVRQYEPVAGIFWDSPTLEELARAQNVKPMTDVQALFGRRGRATKMTVSRRQLMNCDILPARIVSPLIDRCENST